ncbi:DUF202 domain-containing protein [Candidatus Saccharibacteria bacterium]|nr:DUF202 domain-containing protein [Candidatus Saccharibacteria bacterium]
MTKLEKMEQLDVDVRFLLANERTLLAWIRTGLTIQAGGIALTAFHQQSPIPGIIVLLMGALVAYIGYRRFKISDVSIRSGHLPPSDASVVLQVYGLTIVAVAIAFIQVVLAL